MIKCPYLGDKGRWFESCPYCELVENTISENKYKHYCETDYDSEENYKDCDIYKERK